MGNMRGKWFVLLLIMPIFLLFGCAGELAESGALELEEGAADAGIEIAPEVASRFVTEGVIPERFAEEVRLTRNFNGDLLSVEINGNQYTFAELVDRNTIRIYNYNGFGERIVTLPGDIYTVDGEFVRLREGPGTSYQVLGKFERNQIVLVLRQLGDWDEVRTLDGRLGFVAAVFLVASATSEHHKKIRHPKPISLTEQAKEILQLGH